MNTEQSASAGRIRLSPLVVSTIWFVVVVLFLCFAIYVLILMVVTKSAWTAYSQLFLLAAMLRWFVVLPSLLWGGVLFVARALEIKLSMQLHLIVSELAAICSLPIFLFLYNYVEASAATPEDPDPDFDKLGFLGSIGVYGSLSLLVVFPLLTLLLYRFASGMKLALLFRNPSKDR